MMIIARPRRAKATQTTTKIAARKYTQLEKKRPN